MGKQYEDEQKLSRLESLRRKLEKETGLRIDVPKRAETREAEEILERLLMACGNEYSPEELLIQLLTGKLHSSEKINGLRRLGLSADGVCTVFLIYLPGQKNEAEETTIEILRELFVRDRGDYFVGLEDGVIAFLYTQKAKEAKDDEGKAGIRAMAEVLLDTLNMELMLEAKVACSRRHKGTEADAAYAQARKALEVGLMFSGSEHIYYYDCMGARRLIYDLPRETCLAYLNEIFDGEMPDRIDDELIKTARVFFENGMNISDTAKQMFIHRNTLIYRLEKLCRATGLDIRRFEDAFAFRNVALIYERLRNEDHEGPVG